MSEPEGADRNRICDHCGDYILADEGYIYDARHGSYAHTNPLVCWAIFSYLRHSPYPEAEEQAELARLRSEYAWGQDMWEDRYHWFREDLRLKDESWPAELK